MSRINYLGIFSVSRDHIHNRSMSFYKKLIKDFPNHPNAEVGHYLERAWPAVFHPVPKECLYYTNKSTEGFEDKSIINTPLLLMVLFMCSALLALLLTPKNRTYYSAKIAVYLISISKTLTQRKRISLNVVARRVIIRYKILKICLEVQLKVII